MGTSESLSSMGLTLSCTQPSKEKAITVFFTSISVVLVGKKYMLNNESVGNQYEKGSVSVDTTVSVCEACQTLNLSEN